MLRNWLTKAVAICAEAIKQVMAFQLALMVAMLASWPSSAPRVFFPSLHRSP